MDTKRTNIVGVFLALLCTIMFFSGCSTESLNWNPQGDWMYELCRGYYISRSSSSSIALVKEQKIGYSYVVEEYVTCFCYNDDFIAVRKRYEKQEKPSNYTRISMFFKKTVDINERLFYNY